ncbi:hypothetical protein ACW9YQ_27860 (plasmid) [Paraburkholderia strydomiana]
MKTLGQLFEQFVNETVLGKTVAKVNGVHRPMIVILAVKVFAESRKRMWDEGHAGLIADAARALVFERLDDFVAYVKADRTYRYVEPNTLLERTVADVGVESSDLKRQVFGFLKDAQSANFKLDDYVHVGSEIVMADHPMVTFTKKLIELESDKKVSGEKHKKVALRTQADVRFHAQLFNLIRVGNAFFKRHEWEMRTLCNVNEYIEQRRLEKLAEWKTGATTA